jgi:hypothetical protein
MLCRWRSLLDEEEYVEGGDLAIPALAAITATPLARAPHDRIAATGTCSPRLLIEQQAELFAPELSAATRPHVPDVPNTSAIQRGPSQSEQHQDCPRLSQ